MQHPAGGRFGGRDESPPSQPAVGGIETGHVGLRLNVAAAHRHVDVGPVGDRRAFERKVLLRRRDSPRRAALGLQVEAHQVSGTAGQLGIPRPTGNRRSHPGVELALEGGHGEARHAQAGRGVVKRVHRFVERVPIDQRTAVSPCRLAAVEVDGQDLHLVVDQHQIADNHRVIAQRRLGVFRNARPPKRSASEPTHKRVAGHGRTQGHPPAHLPQIDRPRCDLVPNRRAGKGGPVGVRPGAGPIGARRKQRRKCLHVIHLPTAQPPPGVGVQLRQGTQLVPGPTQRAFQDRGQHQPGPNSRQVQIGIGHTQPRAGSVLGRIDRNHLLPVRAGRRVVARLQRHLAQRVECVVAPTAGKRLIEHVLQQPAVATGHALVVPFSGRRVHAAAIQGQCLRRQRGQL